MESIAGTGDNRGHYGGDHHGRFTSCDYLFGCLTSQFALDYLLDSLLAASYSFTPEILGEQTGPVGQRDQHDGAGIKLAGIRKYCSPQSIDDLLLRHGIYLWIDFSPKNEQHLVLVSAENSSIAELSGDFMPEVFDAGQSRNPGLQRCTPLTCRHSLQALVDDRVTCRFGVVNINQLFPRIVDRNAAVKQQFGQHCPRNCVLRVGSRDGAFLIAQGQKYDLFVQE